MNSTNYQSLYSFKLYQILIDFMLLLQLFIDTKSEINYIYLLIMGSVTSTIGKRGVGLGALGGLLGYVAVQSLAQGAVAEAAIAAAQTGIPTAVGSIFGSAIQAQAVLGFSTLNSTVLGITSASIAGAALIVAAIGVGACFGYYVYTRCRDNQATGNPPIIDQAMSESPLDTNTVLTRPQIPEFRPINITKQQFDQAKELTESQFRQCVQKATCPITKQVMRQPYRMKCCKNIPNKTDKIAEKVIIQHQLNTRGRCILCQTQADSSFMEPDKPKQNQIFGLRVSLLKVYKQANSDQKKLWKGWIDSQFGQGYTQKHLENQDQP